MALVTTKRNVDVLPGQAAPTVFHCSQHDVGATIILGLVNAGGNYSIPSGATAIIQGSCSNGAVFTPVTATVSGSDITFNLSAEMTSIAGPTVCEAVLSKDTDVLGTANFILDVEPSAMGSDTPPVFADAAWLWMVDKMGTETVSALDDKTVIDAINEKADQSDVTALSNAKLDKNQGTANAGKYLKVGTDGNVTAEDLDVTTDKTLSITDKAADAKAVGDELDDLKADLNDVVTINNTPTSKTKLLVDTEQATPVSIPEINDEIPSANDTFSSRKILTLVNDTVGDVAEYVGFDKKYTNPLTDTSVAMADPCVVRHEELFYVYATGTRIEIKKSTNLINWEDCSSAINDDDYAKLCILTGKEETFVWAPCVVRRGNLWLMYVSVVSEPTNTNCHMCVFSSPNPEGPWKYRGEITNRTEISLYDCIDASVINDSDGHMYMFLGSSFGVYLIKLTDDGLDMDDSFEKILIHPHGTSDSTDTRLEGEYCYWHNGYYYLFFSAGMYTVSGGYHIVISRSQNLEGPYLNKNGGDLTDNSTTGTTILSGNSTYKSPGHNSDIIIDKDGNYWMLFHAYKDSTTRRQLCLQRVFWGEDGWPYFDGDTVKAIDYVPRF